MKYKYNIIHKLKKKLKLKYKILKTHIIKKIFFFIKEMHFL